MSVALPASLDEALVLLAAPDTTVLAGGTDLMVEVNDGRRPLREVVALRRVRELRAWEVDGNDVVLGAGVTYTDLLDGDLAALVPALAHAARTVGSPQIRNAGTIGGNLGTASPAGDALPPLVALGAQVEVASASGRRTIAIGDFFVGPKRTALAPGELVVSVRVPAARGPQDYLKVGVRNAMVIAVASLAFVADLDARTIGVGLGSVGPTPLAAPEATDWLAANVGWEDDGLRADDATIDRFGDLVAAASRPIDDHRSTAGYRRHAVNILARRALRRARVAPER
jgi:CO/xanthine dehydrogenase FAD-binding subunit